MSFQTFVSIVGRALARDSLSPVWARTGRALAWGVGLFLVFQGLMALTVPWLVKGPGLRAAGQALKRPISLDSVRFNPFVLGLRVRGLRIADPKQPTDPDQDLVKVQGIDLNASMGSLLRGGLVLDHLHIDAPYVKVVRIDAQHFNVSDLMAHWAAGASSPSAASSTASAPGFAVHDLQVRGGQLRFDDRLLKAQHAIEQIQFTLPYVASFAGERDTAIQPLLMAQVHGAELRLGAHTKPFKATRETTLQVSLKGLDLAAALKGWPGLAPWQVHQGTLNTEWQLTLRALGAEEAEEAESGRLSLLAKGQVETEGLRLNNPQGDVIAWDRLALGSDQLNWDVQPQGPQWRVKDARLELDQLKLGDSQDAAKLLSLVQFKLAHADIDGSRQSIDLGEMQWDGLALQAHRSSDGRLNLLSALDRLSQFKGPASVAPLPVSVPQPTHPTSVRPPWQVAIAHMGIRNSQFSWLDEASVPSVKLGVKNMQGDFRRLSTRPDAEVNFKLQTDFAHGGSLALDGQVLVGPRQLRTAVTLSQLDLAIAQPYLSQVLNLQLRKGQLDTQGQLSLDAPLQRDWRLGYQGEASINQLYTSEPATGEDFVRWKRLVANDIDVQITPLALSVKDHIRIGGIKLQELFAKVVIHPDGRINLQDILRRSAPREGGKAELAAGPVRHGSPVVELGGLSISSGRLNFSDQFVQPNYTAKITDLRGTVSAVGPQSPPAQVALQGRIEGYAPLTIEGRINPVGPSLFLDVVAKARGIDLPTLSPYSSRYTGHPIVRGKLSLDVAYKIENSKLEAQNNIFLDQLTLGPRVEGHPTQLPVLFAVSLLKNSRGEIDLRLPVTGSINDPQFSMGGVLWQALGNLIQRAVTAPFTLLASLFKGAQGDLGQVEFNPGTAELTPKSLPRLGKLSEILQDRPSLKLDITVHLDPLNELGDIRRSRLSTRVQDERRQQGATPDPLASTPLSEWSEVDYAQWLQRLYDRTSVPNKPRNAIGIAKKLSVAEMESLLMSSINVSDDELRALAQERAEAVRQVLAPDVPPERLFTLAPIMASVPNALGVAASDAPTTPVSCHMACAAFSLH